MGAEELKELKELTSSLNKMMDELNDKSDKRNRALERQTQLTKRILGDIQSEEDINNGLIKLENQKKAILKSNFGINNKLNQSKNKILNHLMQYQRKLNFLEGKLELTENMYQKCLEQQKNNISNYLERFKFKIEYLEVRNRETLAITNEASQQNASIFIVAWLEGVRLIDNLKL